MTLMWMSNFKYYWGREIWIKKDIKHLIDQANTLVQKGSEFNIQSNYLPNTGFSSSTDSKDETMEVDS